MNPLKSILTFTFLGGLLTLATGCPPGGYYAGAFGAAAAISVINAPRYYPVYPTYPPPQIIRIQPGPFNNGGGAGAGPFQNQNGTVVCGGPFNDNKNCTVSMNNKEISHDEIVAVASSKYGFDSSATDKILASLAAAQKGDSQTAAKNLGMTQAMLEEIKAGSLSDASAEQMATTVGTSTESMSKYIKDVIETTKSQVAPPNETTPSAFDSGNCSNCG